MAQKIRFPMEYLRVTQGRGTGSHLGTKAMDFGGKDAGSDKLYAPCDMKVIRTRTGASGEMYCESTNKVLFANGIEDYVNFTFIHDSSFNYPVGTILTQGQYFYDEGGMGSGKANAFAIHVHVEAGRGKFGTSNPIQVQTVHGTWHTNYNPMNLEDVFFVGNDVIVLGTGGYTWKKYAGTAQTVGTPVARNEKEPQVEILIDDLRGRTRPEMGDATVAGYINKGVYNILDTRDMTGEASNGFYWYKIEANLWCAKSAGAWTNELAVVTPPPDTNKDAMIAELQAQVAAYKADAERTNTAWANALKLLEEANAQISVLQKNKTTLQDTIKQIATLAKV